MLVEILAGMFGIFVCLLFWLKSKLPSVSNYSKELVAHNNMFNQEWDADKDVAELQKVRDEKYLEMTENYYDFTTQLFHIIWGPRKCSMDFVVVHIWNLLFLSSEIHHANRQFSCPRNYYR